MTRFSIHTPNAAPPAGPYSQAIRAGDLVFVSGQLPLDPEGFLVGAGDIRAQTRQVFANIEAILRAAGSSLDRVVKTTVFLTNLDDFAGMNDVYASVFKQPYPARSTVETGRLPGGMLLEVECVAQVERTAP
ncbi:2-iminobutanoate/2-iminopropanoate deaminase [Microvirga flocculans]|uniref:2-iminobutanoate/2-iminopropanoate deaminase n=1 Tax=Microvirga flocculans TaxID=217168 RepID=A0A7W6IHK3_9HYPH|nr:RidA family protein [Microvirga flocculans]MBB4040979.1 2-iminobutanoate/2-iminopropanoate deaminase [Microvirga flocculans]